MGNTHRQCAVRINNNTKTFIMVNPRVFMDSGRCEDALPDPIGPSAGGSALFVKTPDTACGAVGVFTYDLFNESTQRDEKKIAVMFHNPYDFNLYSNMYAVGIFDRRQLCDSSLYNKMYNQTQTGFVRGKAGSRLTYSKDGFTISANMTNTNQPELDVDISNSDV